MDLQFLSATADVPKMTVKDLLRVVEYQQLQAGLPIPKKKVELRAAILELKERGPLTGTQIYNRKVMAVGHPLPFPDPPAVAKTRPLCVPSGKVPRGGHYAPPMSERCRNV